MCASHTIIQLLCTSQLLPVLTTRLILVHRVFLPACDIPPFVGSGHVDLGITGQDRILESQMSDFVTEVLKLDFGHCKLQVQVPNESPIQTVKELAGKRVTTSYPAIASEYFGKVDESVGLTESQRTQIRFIAGSVESSCTLGLADGISESITLQIFGKC
jgi:ATP phosphoribosyltransferase